MNKQNQFARLFWYNEHQILIRKSYDSDEELDALTVSTQHSGIEVSYALKFYDQTTRDKAFDTLDEREAGKALFSIIGTAGIELQ